jgi:hypothetical protein
MSANNTTTAVTATAPNAAADPFDPAAFAVSPEALMAQGDVGVVPVLTGLSVRKPSKQEFFRVSSDARFMMTAPLLELKEEREVYLVAPAVAATMPGDIMMKELRLCQNRQGSLFLWPLPVISVDARQRNEWHSSARQACTIATTKWCRMTADMSSGRYNVAIAPGITVEPIWPSDLTMRDLLELGFGRERLIAERGHPLVKRLLGVE